jgi:hypothetical protein
VEQLSNLSKPIKIGAAAGALLIVVLLAFTVLKPHSKPTTAVTAAPKPPPVAKSSAKQALELTPGLPPALHAALLGHLVVVAVLASGDGDGDLVSTARQGAKAAHAGFAVLNVGNETVARDVAMLVPGLGGSGVLVFRRPGTVAEALPTYTDADTVAQAATDSKAPPTTTTTAALPPATTPTTTP